MCSYYVVKFLKDDLVEAVPDVWVEFEEEIKCWWPPVCVKRLLEYIQTGKKPSPCWRQYPVLIIGKCANFDTANSKAESMSTIFKLLEEEMYTHSSVSTTGSNSSNSHMHHSLLKEEPDNQFVNILDISTKVENGTASPFPSPRIDDRSESNFLLDGNNEDFNDSKVSLDFGVTKIKDEEIEMEMEMEKEEGTKNNYVKCQARKRKFLGSDTPGNKLNARTSAFATVNQTTNSVTSLTSAFVKRPRLNVDSEIEKPGVAFTSLESLQEYLQNDLVSGPFMPTILDPQKFSHSARRVITRTVTNKMLEDYGDYPNTSQKMKVAALLGKLFGLPAAVFFEKSGHGGYLTRCLENSRRKWEPSRKRTRKSKEADQSLLSKDVQMNKSSDPITCCRGEPNCELCVGVSEVEESIKMQALENTRVDEIMFCAARTYCYRHVWIVESNAPASTILEEYPKFQILPQLIDQDFSFLHPECVCNFVKDYPIEALLRYAVLVNNDYQAQQAANEANTSHEDWKAYFATKIACLSLRMVLQKKRIPGIEAFDQVMCILPPGTSISEFAESYDNPAPILLIQGDVESHVIAVKIAVEKKIIEAGSSILEGLDRLFKMFWIFNIAYTPAAFNFYVFLQIIYRIPHNSTPMTVTQLHGIISKFL